MTTENTRATDVEIDALGADLRRLRGEVSRLEEDKGELERRIALLLSELDQPFSLQA